MSRYRTRLLECLDCAVRTRFSIRECESATAARCPACGCAALQFVTSHPAPTPAEPRPRRTPRRTRPPKSPEQKAAAKLAWLKTRHRLWKRNASS